MRGWRRLILRLGCLSLRLRCCRRTVEFVFIIPLRWTFSSFSLSLSKHMQTLRENKCVCAKLESKSNLSFSEIFYSVIIAQFLFFFLRFCSLSLSPFVSFRRRAQLSYPIPHLPSPISAEREGSNANDKSSFSFFLGTFSPPKTNRPTLTRQWKK